MGNLLSFALEQKPDKNLLIELKSSIESLILEVMLEQLIDCIDTYDSNTPNSLYLTFTDYCGVIIFITKFFPNCYNYFILDKVFQLLSENEGVLKYELYVLFIMLSKGSFESKINSIFNIFCINEDDSLNSEDLILLVKCTLSPIFKLCKIKHASDEDIKMFLIRNFPKIFQEEFDLLYEEYYDWLASNDEVQAFLIEFFDIQTRFNAIKIYVKYLAEFEMIFDNQEQKVDIPKSTVLNSQKIPFKRKNSIQSKITSNTFSKATDEFSNSFCKIEDILNTIGEILSKIDPKINTIFKELIDPDNSGWVRKDRYMRAIQAICLFMAVDKDMSHTLSRSEIGTLIWLLTGEEPLDIALQTTLQYLDSNKDSAIELNEWLEYLSTRDSKGRKVINYTLKQKFDLYDEDGSGTISINELEKLIVDSFSEEIVKMENSAFQQIAESIVRDLSKSIMSKMDLNNSDNLDWTEFKNYLYTALTEENKIAEFLERFS